MRDMAINFFKYFDPEKSKANFDCKKMGDLICSCLDDEYLPLKGINLKKMTEIVNDNGIDVKSETIRRDLKVIQLTRRFFMAGKEERKEILKQVNTGNAYRDYFGTGIKHLLKNGITEWEQILSLMKNETMPKKEETVLVSVKQKIAQEQVVVMTTSEDEDVDMVSQRVDEAKSLLEDSCEKFVQIITKIKAEHNQNKQKLVACFDQLRELSGTGDIARGLKEALVQKEALFQGVVRERDFFREEIGKLEKENVGLREEKELIALMLLDSDKKIKVLEQQIAELDKDGVLKKVLALLSEKQRSELPQPIIEKTPLPSQEQEKGEEKELPRKENGLPELPNVYVPINVGVEFKKPFMTFLKNLYFGNKKTAKSVISTITNICQNGLEGISNNKKTMDGPSNTGNSPPNCVQVNVKKLRLSLKVQGDGVVFYELYYRKESVYGDRN